MSTVADIEAAITKLSRSEAEEVREWLEQWIEDQREMTPEFLASIERGKTDLAEGRTRIVAKRVTENIYARHMKPLFVG